MNRFKSTWNLVFAFYFVLVCGCSFASKKPQLSDRQREVVERRNRYGKETTFTHETSDDLWRYSSKNDDWTHRWK